MHNFFIKLINLINYFHKLYYYNIYFFNFKLYLINIENFMMYNYNNQQNFIKNSKYFLKKKKLFNNNFFYKIVIKNYNFKYLNFLLFFNNYYKNYNNKYKKYTNKFYCFWPIFKKKNFFSIWLKNNYKKKKNVLFLKKQQHTKKKSYFFNFHRRLIKIFWKSQIHFKNNFLLKTRFTTRKFKNKFLHWYKKNKKINKNILNKLIYIVTQNFLFLSKNCLTKLKKFKILLKNGKFDYNHNSLCKINDILSFPSNYIDFIYDYLIGKFNLIKKLKKKNFIFFKNKTSQWKNLKKKPIGELDYFLYSFNKITQFYEFDIFSGNLIIVKNNKNFNIRFEKIIRHNLEKLNVYKLNV